MNIYKKVIAMFSAIIIAMVVFSLVPNSGYNPLALSDEIHFNFEGNNLHGFRVVSGSFGPLPSFQPYYQNNISVKHSHEGDYFISTWWTGTTGTDSYIGEINSPAMILSSNLINFQIGGCSQEIGGCYVALCYSDSGQEIIRAYSPVVGEEMFRINWTLPNEVIGAKVYVKIYDGSGQPGWHGITFDDFYANGTVLANTVDLSTIEQLTGCNSDIFKRLKNTIEDLKNTYGDQYVNGADYLLRFNNLQIQYSDFISSIGTANAPTTQQLESFKTAFFALNSEAILANPLIVAAPIAFVTRQQYQPDHHNTHTMFPSAPGETNVGAYSPGGTLKTIEFSQGGKVTTLKSMPDGVIRDVDVSYDGTKLLFSMRKSTSDSYHIFEMGNDGLNLNQLTTRKDVDDMDPLYLPNGKIAFSSTREPKYVMCNRHIGANIYSMGNDGSNVVRITNSTLFERPSDVMPDGRILYDRWEYNDRDFGSAQGLWTVNPDGTEQNVYFGNNHPSGAVIDSKIIPGTNKAIAVLSSTHDRPWGALGIIDREIGVDGKAPVIQTWPPEARNILREPGTGDDIDAFLYLQTKYEDPTPLSDKYFLCSRMVGKGEKMGIYLVDVFGNETLLYEDAAANMGAFDPVVLAPKNKPLVIMERRNYTNNVGTFIIQNVYAGTNMTGVTPGSVKTLRVVESLAKKYHADGLGVNVDIGGVNKFLSAGTWAGQGIQVPAMNWNSFEAKRILGEVPVEADGSCYFEVTSDKFVYFQLLDENGKMIQTMRSGTTIQSGEKTTCVGCHDDRGTTAVTEDAVKIPIATLRSPSKLPAYDQMVNYNYLSEVQPVFDAKCIACHDYGGTGAKKIVLAGDKTVVFNISYIEIWRGRMNLGGGNYCGAIGGGNSTLRNAKTWGSYTSKLIQKIETGHGGATADEIKKIAQWIDLNAVYYPDYSSNYPNNPAGRAPITMAQLGRISALSKIQFDQFVSGYSEGNFARFISFTRPEKSLLLNYFTPGNADYNEILSIIRSGQTNLLAVPDVDMQGYKITDNPVDAWRLQKYILRDGIENANRAAIASGVKLYDNNHPADPLFPQQ